MMIEEECIKEELLMKRFELVNSRKRAREDEDYQNLNQLSPEFDYVVAYNPPVNQVPFKEVLPPDWTFLA